MRFVVTFILQNKVVQLYTNEKPWDFVDRLTLKYNLPILDNDVLVFEGPDGVIDAKMEADTLAHITALCATANKTLYLEESALADAVTYTA